MSESLDLRPTLLETQMPVNLLSAEAYKERKAGPGQTLTCLGSYWKGRKPLILVRACVLAALIPAGTDARRDREIFLKLMRMDEASLRVRKNKPVSAALVREALGEAARASVIFGAAPDAASWRRDVAPAVRVEAQEQAWQRLSYEFKLTICARPEEVDEAAWPDIWPEVNAHLGTDAQSIPELVEQLGQRRFGHRPRVADPFCGGGSIPFEAARVGCDVYASDLNPIAGMLTWGALNIVGGPPEQHAEIRAAQARVAAAVRAEIDALGIEQGEDGWRGKVYLYCLEITCPQTGWKIPLAPSWVISETHRVVAVLVPEESTRSFRIDLVHGASAEQLEAARRGTVRDSRVHHPHPAHRAVVHAISTLRGDRADGTNALRRWELSDFEPRAGDVFQERLYAIQWIRESAHGGRAALRFAAVTDADLAREETVRAHVRANLARWQADGWVPDMEIEPGEKTDEPIRMRGWTYWHHLFNGRQLSLLASYFMASGQAFDAGPSIARLADLNSRLCRWNSGQSNDKAENTFYNQALNPMYNYAVRSASYAMNHTSGEYTARWVPGESHKSIVTSAASLAAHKTDLLITDPPYGDAVNYHEITEFFIAWLRKRPPEALKDWVWDSRRALAMKGSGYDFRVAMVEAFSNFARQMPDNGLQVVMFTHSKPEVWASLVRALWAAGLQVKAAWYILTETSAGVRDANLVQGTSLLVLRKRQGNAAGWSRRLHGDVRRAVETKLASLQALDDPASPTFADLDLIQAGYAAACEVLTAYGVLDDVDVHTDVLQADPEPVARGRKTKSADAPEPSRQSLVVELLERAARVATERLIPARLERGARGAEPGDRDAQEVWAALSGEERFVLKALDAEAEGARKLGSLMELAKLFGLSGWRTLLASSQANDARLRNAAELRADELVTTSNAGSAAPSMPAFAQGIVRHALYGIALAQEADDLQKALRFFEQFTPEYWERRQDLVAVLQFIGQVRSPARGTEAEVAASLAGAVRNHTP